MFLDHSNLFPLNHWQICSLRHHMIYLISPSRIRQCDVQSLAEDFPCDRLIEIEIQATITELVPEPRHHR